MVTYNFMHDADQIPADLSAQHTTWSHTRCSAVAAVAMCGLPFPASELPVSCLQVSDSELDWQPHLLLVSHGRRLMWHARCQEKGPAAGPCHARAQGTQSQHVSPFRLRASLQRLGHDCERCVLLMASCSGWRDIMLVVISGHPGTS